MTNLPIAFPAIGFKDRDAGLYVFDQHIGIISKGGERFYKNLTLVDNQGQKYRLLGAKVKGKAGWRHSLKYMQPMFEMDLTFEEIDFQTLAELKSDIMSHVSQHPKRWLSLDTVEGIQEMVDRSDSFEGLINLFK